MSQSRTPGLYIWLTDGLYDLQKTSIEHLFRGWFNIFKAHRIQDTYERHLYCENCKLFLDTKNNNVSMGDDSLGGTTSKEKWSDVKFIYLNQEPGSFK